MFSELAATDFTTANLTGVDDPESLSGYRVTASLLPLLGVEPRVGRGFTIDDERPGSPAVAMISERYWRKRYGGDPAIVGESIRLNDTIYTLVGVVPRGCYAYGPLSTFMDFWLPLTLGDNARGRYLDRDASNDAVTVYGRLRPGLDSESALSELETHTSGHDTTLTQDRTGWGIHVTPFYARVLEQRGGALALYWGASGAVLLIACVNVALMMLARAVRRRREFALRSALGAGRRRLVRQLLAESLLLALAGGAAGIVLAYALGPMLISLAPANDQRAGLELMRIDSFTLGFTLLTASVTALGFGLVPALRGSAVDLSSSLKHTAGAGFVDRGGRRFQDALVIVAVGSSLTLLTAAALLGASFLRAQQVDPGYRPQQVLTARVPVPLYKYADVPARARFYQDVLERVQALPGVRSAAVAAPLPLGNMELTTRLLLEGETAELASDMRSVHFGSVTPEFFTTLGVPLLAGRSFSDADTAEAPPVVVANQAAAREYWPGENPLGKHTYFDPSREHPPATVVGVVGDVHYRRLTEEPTPILYRPITQSLFGTYGMTLMLRSDGDPMALASSLRRELSAVDPEAPLADIRTMGRVVDQSLAGRRYLLTIVGLFSGLVLLLALVGVYGVVSYTVAQRTQEIGLRMALGASGRDALHLVLRRTAAVVGAGLLLGVAASFVVGRLVEDQLFGIEADDPGVIAGAAAVLLLGALTAAALPARRASRIAPMDALRHE